MQHYSSIGKYPWIINLPAPQALHSVTEKKRLTVCLRFSKYKHLVQFLISASSLMTVRFKLLSSLFSDLDWGSKHLISFIRCRVWYDEPLEQKISILSLLNHFDFIWNDNNKALNAVTHSKRNDCGCKFRLEQKSHSYKSYAEKSICLLQLFGWEYISKNHN